MSRKWDTANAMAFADFDQDGLWDLLIDVENAGLGHYEQVSSDSYEFTLINDDFIEGLTFHRSQSTIFDIDGDGLLELILHSYQNPVFHFEQDSVNSNNFIQIESDLVDMINDQSIRDDTFIDIDNNGQLDMIAMYSGICLNRFEQDTENPYSFHLEQRYFNNFGCCSPQIYNNDYNGNTLLDLLSFDNQSEFCVWFEQDIPGSVLYFFKEDSLLTFPNTGCWWNTVMEDIDRNERYDVIAFSTFEGNAMWFEQNDFLIPSFSLVDENFISFDIDPLAIVYPVLCDLDSDRKFDLMIAGTQADDGLYEQVDVGSTTFELIDDQFDYPWMYSDNSSIADLDQDGLLDAVMMGYDHIYHYEQEAANSHTFIENNSGVLDHFADCYRDMSMSDVNQDGYTDLIFQNKIGGLSLFLQDPPEGVEDSPAIPSTFECYPNPFNPDLTISFSLSKPAAVSVDVFNIRGEKVRTVASARFSTGDHKVEWNGMNQSDQPVASGIYLIRLKSDQANTTRKVLLLK